MYVLIYVRVSTDKQAEKELSLPAQLDACRQYAAERDWQTVEEFIEPGVSARTADRPELKRLLSRCRDSNPAIGVVIVHKLDRLARNVADHVAIRSMLAKSATTLVSVSENLDDSVSGQLVEHIMAAIAEFYSANLSEEVKKGMRQKIVTGGWPHQVPRGYQIHRVGESSFIVIDDGAAPLVRKAFETCAMNYSGLIDFRRRLAVMGLCAKSGQPLSNAGVVRMLTNPFYCGKMRWNGKLYQGKHPALFSQTLFDQVQLILKARSRQVHRRPVRFLLGGLARCRQCGSYMGGEQHKNLQYYRCRGAFRLKSPCRARYCRLDRAHQQLELVYRNVVLSAGQRVELLRRVRDAALEQNRKAEAQRMVLQMQQGAVEQREHHLTSAFGEGLLTAQAFTSALENNSAERASLVEQLNQLRSAGAGRVTPLRPAIERARSAWDLHIVLSLAQQRVLGEIVFARLDLDQSGITAYEVAAQVTSTNPGVVAVDSNRS